MNPVRFGSAKIEDFFDFQIFQQKNSKVWLLSIEAGCKDTVAFFAGASYSRNKFRHLWLTAVGKTTCVPLEFPTFQFMPQQMLTAFPLVRLTFRDCKGMTTFWGGKQPFAK